MAKATYREIGGPKGHLVNRRDFKGNSLEGHRFPDGSYVVISYRTCIARLTPDGEKWVTDSYYSMTTQRHKCLCRAWL